MAAGIRWFCLIRIIDHQFDFQGGSGGGEEDLFDDEDDDELMRSVIEVDEEEMMSSTKEAIDTKEKAEEDSFQALNLVPPTRQQTTFLKNNFGHPAFKPLQWKIIK